MRALLIDRDKSFHQGFSFFLKNKGFVVDSALTGDEGTEFIRLYSYDIILLALELPDMGGTDMLKKMRATGVETPVIVLSGITAVSKKVECFSLGADDYVVKPCDRNELFARIQAVTRRSRGYAHPVVRVGKMEINLDTKVVKIANKVLPLTGKEYSLLELLCLRRGMTVSKEQFLNHLYGGMDAPEMKIIDVFLWRIRHKIEQLSGGEQYIQTVWGRGYILQESLN